MALERILHPYLTEKFSVEKMQMHDCIRCNLANNNFYNLGKETADLIDPYNPTDGDFYLIMIGYDSLGRKQLFPDRPLKKDTWDNLNNNGLVFGKDICITNKNITNLTNIIENDIIPILTSANDKGHKVTSSSIRSDYPQRADWRAFDGNTSDYLFWCPTNGEFPCWLQIELPTPKKANVLELMGIRQASASPYTQDTIRKFELYASNDKVNYKLLYGSQMRNDMLESDKFKFINKTAYKFYKIIIYDNWCPSIGWSGIQKMQLHYDESNNYEDLTPILSSDNDKGYKLSASNIQSTYYPYKMFLGNDVFYSFSKYLSQYGWAPYTGSASWVKIEFPKFTFFDTMQFIVQNCSTTDAPNDSLKDIEILVSDDDINYISVAKTVMMTYESVKYIKLNIDREFKYLKFITTGQLSVNQYIKGVKFLKTKGIDISSLNVHTKLLSGGISSADKDNEWDKIIENFNFSTTKKAVIPTMSSMNSNNIKITQSFSVDEYGSDIIFGKSWRMFDNKANTTWYTWGSPTPYENWVVVELPSNTVVNKLTITPYSYSSYGYHGCDYITIYGSNDSINYTKILDKTNCFNGNGVETTIDIPNYIYYKFYKMVFNIETGTAICISKLQLYEASLEERILNPFLWAWTSTSDSASTRTLRGLTLINNWSKSITSNIHSYRPLFLFSKNITYLIESNGIYKTLKNDVWTDLSETILSEELFKTKGFEILPSTPKFLELENAKLLCFTNDTEILDKTLNISGHINNLKFLNNPHILVYANDADNVDITIAGILKDRLIKQINSMSLDEIDNIDLLEVIHHIISDGKLKLLFSNDDGITWNGIVDSTITIVNISDMEDIKNKSVDVNDLKSMYSLISDFALSTKKIQFAYLFELNNKDTIIAIDTLKIQFDASGHLIGCVNGTDYTYEYSNNKLIVKLLKNGSYKINYID